jgi:hypothetical protein
MVQDQLLGCRKNVQPQTQTAEKSGAAKMPESNVSKKTISGMVAKRPVCRVALIPLMQTMKLGIAQRLGCAPQVLTKEERKLLG